MIGLWLRLRRRSTHRRQLLVRMRRSGTMQQGCAGCAGQCPGQTTGVRAVPAAPAGAGLPPLHAPTLRRVPQALRTTTLLHPAQTAQLLVRTVLAAMLMVVVAEVLPPPPTPSPPNLLLLQQQVQNPATALLLLCRLSLVRCNAVRAACVKTSGCAWYAGKWDALDRSMAKILMLPAATKVSTTRS